MMSNTTIFDGIDVSNDKIAEILLKTCNISLPPTDYQLVFDFMKIKDETFDVSDSPFEEIEKNVRAIANIQTKEIWIHKDITNTRRGFFSRFHELGHLCLPEHREVFLYKCNWEDLGYASKKRLEIEANEFAANCIFQGDRFVQNSLDYKFGFKAILELAETYNASIESTAYRYVKKNMFPCALVVYKPDNNDKTLKVKYTVTSKTFNTFAYLTPGQVASDDSFESQVFFSDMIHNKPKIGEIQVRSSSTGRIETLNAECFSNHYDLLELVFPKIKLGRR